MSVPPAVSVSGYKLDAFTFAPWTIHTAKGKILSQEQEKSYSEVLKLPHFPDMVFSQNLIRLEHDNGFGIEFTPLDALKTVNDHQDLVHVSLAEKWMEARKDSPHINKIIHPYDWTYTPADYRGRLFPAGDADNDDAKADADSNDEADAKGRTLKAIPTDLKIDYEKLQVKEKILFFDEVILFEDELDDNGSSVLSLKIRVMPSGFFCLCRFYLRVDNTLIRVIDTRLYYEVGNNYLLREYTERESKMSDLTVPFTVLRDQNEIVKHLQLKTEVVEKLEFPV